jgi:hypothetical protein
LIDVQVLFIVIFSLAANVPFGKSNNGLCHEGSDEERTMRTKSSLSKAIFNVSLLAGLLLLASIAGFARDKNETIDATAWGTSTQLGRNVGITLIIYG